MANATKASSKLKVLYSEGNAEVLTAHAVSLQNAGHQVESALGRQAVLDALQHGTFDLVVLGPTLTKNDRHHLAYKVKKANEQTRVLVLHSDGEHHPAVDANLDTGRSMQDVVAKIAAMWPKFESAQGLSKAAAAGK
jgi:DNA-binding NtrC family response regulator